MADADRDATKKADKPDLSRRGGTPQEPVERAVVKPPEKRGTKKETR